MAAGPEIATVTDIVRAYCDRHELSCTAALLVGSCGHSAEPADIDVILLGQTGPERHYDIDSRLDVTIYPAAYLRRLFRHPEHWLMNWEFECGKFVNGCTLWSHDEALVVLRLELARVGAWFSAPLRFVRLGQMIDWDTKRRHQAGAGATPSDEQADAFAWCMRERTARLLWGLERQLFPDSYLDVFRCLRGTTLTADVAALIAHHASQLQTECPELRLQPQPWCANETTVLGLKLLEAKRPAADVFSSLTVTHDHP